MTGQPSCGKTTLVKHLVQLATDSCPQLPLKGFVTEEVLSGASRIGFDVVSVGADPPVHGVLARKGFKSRAKTGAYGVNVAAFERAALPLLRGTGKRIVVIDEVGRMEMHSTTFVEEVKSLMDDDSVLLLGSVAAPRYGHTVALAEAIKARADVETLHVKPSTRTEVTSRAEQALKVLLESGGYVSQRKRKRMDDSS